MNGFDVMLLCSEFVWQCKLVCSFDKKSTGVNTEQSGVVVESQH